MEVSIHPGIVNGTIAATSSKSVLQRYIAAALLADGMTELHGISHCDDTVSCLFACQSLGAKTREVLNETLYITGCNSHIQPALNTIYCGESGLAFRMLVSIASLSDQELKITGGGSLKERPVSFFDEVMPLLNVSCKTTEGHLPVRIQGPAIPTEITIDGSLSSQFLTGLLMIYPLAKRDNTIHVKNLKSKPYIDVTLKVLSDFGIKIMNDRYEAFNIPGNQTYKSCKANVEGDWSSAAFMLVAGAIAGEVTLTQLVNDSLQSDKAIMNVLKDAGAEIIYNNNSIIAKKKPLKAFSFDATHCPDLFPPLVALAAQCEGTSTIKGVTRLIHKESNRAEALVNEFSKLNQNMISVSGDEMIIKGKMKLKATTVDSHNDHRIAMALAVAALNAEGTMHITGMECIDKSYPRFVDDLKKLGVKVSE